MTFRSTLTYLPKIKPTFSCVRNEKENVNFPIFSIVLANSIISYHISILLLYCIYGFEGGNTDIVPRDEMICVSCVVCVYFVHVSCWEMNTFFFCFNNDIVRINAC